MATVAAVAIKRDHAIQAIHAAATKLSTEFGVDSIELPTYNRDPEMLRADQLTALASWLNSLVSRLDAPQKAPARPVASRRRKVQRHGKAVD